MLLPVAAKTAGLVGVAVAEFVDGAPVPTLFVAATRKRYPVPFISPVTVQLVFVPEHIDADSHEAPPFVEY